MPYHIEDNGDGKLIVIFKQHVSKADAEAIVVSIGASVKGFVKESDPVVVVVAVPKEQKARVKSEFLKDPNVSDIEDSTKLHPHG